MILTLVAMEGAAFRTHSNFNVGNSMDEVWNSSRELSVAWSSEPFLELKEFNEDVDDCRRKAPR